MKIKKTVVILLLALVVLGLSACSTPGNAFAYPEPFEASETSTVVGTGMNYAEARAIAIEKAIAENHTKVIAEIIEVNGWTGYIDVTLVMVK